MAFLISFVFGAIFGSFVSVLIWRIKNNEKGIILGRSKCPKCGHILQADELIPIFSYLILKGKCKNCKQKISPIYPILELTTGLAFVFATYLILQNNFSLNYFTNNLNYIIYSWIVVTFMIALAFYDILFYEISYIITAILAILIILPQIFGVIGNVKLAIILGLIGFIAFLTISFVWKLIKKTEGMGGGDAIAAVILGLLTPILIDLLNLQSFSPYLSFYILILSGFFVGALIGILGLTFKKLNKLSKLPFIPFMFLGTILFAFVGKEILLFLSS